MAIVDVLKLTYATLEQVSFDEYLCCTLIHLDF